MKYTLTVQSDDPAEIASFLARANGTGIAPLAANVQAQDADDDETAPVANVAPGQLDSRGFPWDARIHSKAKSTNKDGSWRRLKGVNDTVVTAVEAEYKAAQPTPATFGTQPAPQMPQHFQQQPAPQFPQPTPAPVFQAPQFSQPAPQPDPAPQYQPQPAPQFQQPPTPQYQPQPAPQPVATGPDFGQLMQALQRGTMTAGPNGAPLIDQAYIAQLSGRIGQMIGRALTNITELQGDANGVQCAFQLLQADGRLV